MFCLTGAEALYEIRSNPKNLSGNIIVFVIKCGISGNHLYPMITIQQNIVLLYIEKFPFEHIDKFLKITHFYVLCFILHLYSIK